MSRKSASRTLLVTTVPLTALLAGCLSVPPPPDDLAARHVGTPGQFSELSANATPMEVGAGWLSELGDTTLEALVREAWDRNPDLYVTASRFEEAAARLRIAASFLYPQAAGVGEARHTDFDGSTDEDEYFAALQVSWEADLWGRLRADRSAAARVAESAGLDFIQARHSLAAAVAQAYFAVIVAQQQLAIDNQLLEAERFTAVTTRQRVEAGLLTSLDLNLAESSVRLAEAAVQDDLSALREARRALELLLGRYPSAELDAAPEVLPRFSTAPVAVSVPAELLERRPDVRSVERLVDAAYFDIRSARAARLPRLVLTADARTLIDPSDFITSVAAEILAPLFQGGRLQAEEAVANARQRQALGQFASVALRAFSEVESALSTARFLDERERSLADASSRLQEASEAAINRYEQGLLTILDLQQIRRQDYDTRSLLLGVQFEQLRQRLNLYLALGGPPLLDGEAPPPVPLNGQFADPNDAPVSGDLHVGVPGEPKPDPVRRSDNGG